MPRSTWKGAISFGLISIPVRLYGATEAKDVSFHQVHAADGGRIRYQRVCEKCGEVIEYADIAKGYEAADGRLAILDSDDFESLPLSSSKTVDIVQFVDESEIDPMYFEKSYFIQAEGAGTKPYVLLRDALRNTAKAGVVKVAMRSRESLALIRAKDDVLVLDTMLWPDEIRDSQFAAPDADVKASKQEVAMAESFVTQLTEPWDPTQFEDDYRTAVEELVNAKLAGAPVPVDASTSTSSADVVDLVAALKASVEAAKQRRTAQESSDADAASEERQAS